MMTRLLLLLALSLAGCASCDDATNPKDLGGDDVGVDAGDLADASEQPSALTVSVEPTTVMVVEGGLTSTFAVSLNRAPDRDVVLSWSPRLLELEPNLVQFGPDDWGPRIVTVRAIDNDLLDDSTTETLTATVLGSELAVDDVVVTIVDDDDPMIAVTMETIMMVEGDTASLGVVIGAQPNADVTFAISVDDANFTVEPDELTFLASNPGVTRTVTITHTEDDISEANVSARLRLGPAVGGGYDGVEAEVFIFSGDDDVAQIVVDPPLLNTSEFGESDTFEVRLGSEPLSPVTVMFAGDATEGAISPGTVQFDADNWATPQTITVTGVDEGLCLEGDVVYSLSSLASSADDTYDGLSALPITVTNQSFSDCSMVVTPTALSLNEGESASFSMAVAGVVRADARVSIESSDPTRVAVSDAELLFTPTGGPQDVVVSAVDDNFCDGDAIYQIITTLEPGMHGILGGPADVAVAVVDDETCAVDVQPRIGLVTNEAGGSDTFDAVLTAEPRGDVVVSFTSSNPDEGTVSPDTVTFTPANWNVSQTVTVTGVDDLCCNGNELYQIDGMTSSADPSFDGLTVPSVTVSNLDDDSCGFTVLPNPGGTPQRTNESGTSVTFTVSTRFAVCGSPGATITIPVLVTDPTEGTVSPSELVFTPQQDTLTVTVTGVDDGDVDGPQQYTVILDTTSSTDPFYDNLDPPNVPIINDDDD